MVYKGICTPIPHPICHLLDEMSKKGDIFPMEKVRDEGKKGER